MVKDLNSAQNAVINYAKGEAELGFAKERKKNGIFGGVMDNAIEQHFKEEEQKRLKFEEEQRLREGEALKLQEQDERKLRKEKNN